MSGWSWYDKRDGKRTTVATFLTRESAQERLDHWLHVTRYKGNRPDLLDLLGNVEVRPVEPE